ncbi:MAG: pentapeptide repeat-containing protein [Armatimonadetes bacterium]|nr:pentapeptide repeat-containing protein [Armatimonadota bacterium]
MKLKLKKTPKAKPQPKARRAWRYACWGLAALITGIGGMITILSMAGPKAIPSCMNWWPLKAEKLADSAQGSVVTAAVAWVGGTIALLTFLLNRDQKELHHADQLQTTRTIAETQRQQEYFASLSTDLSSTDKLTRLTAVIGLGEIAMTPAAGSKDLAKLHRFQHIRFLQAADEVAHKPKERNRTVAMNKFLDDYPYFERACSRLTLALQQWTDEASLATVVNTIHRLLFWAAQSNDSDEMLVLLANSLANANREAIEGLVSVGAQYMKRQSDFEAFDLVIQNGIRASECAAPADKVAAEFIDYLAERIRRKNQDIYVKQEQGLKAQENIDPKIALSNAYARLLDTQRLLASTLTLLPYPNGVGVPEVALLKPAHSVSPKNDINALMLQKNVLISRRGLNLTGICLVGNDISGSNLQVALLSTSLILGCKCAEIGLQFSACKDATFAYSDLESARLDAADFLRVNLSDTNCSAASLIGCHLVNTNFGQANLQDSNLVQAKLKLVNLSGAKMDRANLSLAFLDNVAVKSTSLKDAAVKGTLFCDVDLSGAILDGVDMSQAIITSLNGNASAKG